MNMLTSPSPRCRTSFDLVIGRPVAGTSYLGPAHARDSLPLGRSGALTFDARFERVGAGWRTSGRLQCFSRGRIRSERIDIAVSECELRIVPHSKRAGQWGTRRLLRYFRLAHEAADAIVDSLSSTEISRTGIDPPATGAPTLSPRTIETGALIHGFHS
jgi:hypothetical protein